MTSYPPGRPTGAGDDRSLPASLSAEIRSNLLAAWAAWDARPGAERAARELIDTQKSAADELGMGMLVFQDALAAARRSGLDRDDALDHVLGNQM